jgi:glycosyltransferase involved in cell wall biosynthesis
MGEVQTSRTPRLSVIMPSFNEEGSIEAAVRDVQQHVFTLLDDAELLVIDSSRDRTPEVLARLSAQDPRIRVIEQPPRGHGPALRTGMDLARGEYLFLVDSDRQIPLDAFARLWEQVQGRDAALGMRVQRNDPWLRLRLTALVRHTIGLLFGTRIHDANVPFKLVRRDVWLQAAPLIPPDALAPSMFLALFLRAGGFSVVEMPTPHQERQTGVVSIRRWKLFKICVRGLGELIAFRSRLGRWKQHSRARTGASRTQPRPPALTAAPSLEVRE